MQRFISKRQWWLYSVIINSVSIAVVAYTLLKPNLNTFFQQQRNVATQQSNQPIHQACLQASKQWRELQTQWPMLINPTHIETESIIRLLKPYNCHLVNLERERKSDDTETLIYKITVIANWQAFVRLFNHFEYQDNWLLQSINLKPRSGTDILTIDLTLKELLHD